MIKPFNVIIYDPNRNVFEPYDVMPYFIEEYEEAKDKPKTHNEFMDFVEKVSHYRFWSRCEYEIILVDWPCKQKEDKWDIHDQVMMNLDTIADLLMENVSKKKK